MPIPSAEEIRARALSEGFAVCGFAEPGVPADRQARLHEFVTSGQHGTMDWMEGRIDQRADPKVLWPEALGLILLGFSYAPPADPMQRLKDSSRANVSAYAWGRDYHDVVKKAAKRLARWLSEVAEGEVKVFVDTAPVMEKPLAEQAGLGWQGKHTNLVSAAHGSWLFLAEIMTAFELPTDPPARDQCGTCTRCLDVCPTQAMPTPYTLDARRCLAYLSIEHEGPIPTEFRSAMGNRIYGCDDCLAVCPWNKFAEASQETRFFQDEIEALSLEQALSFEEPTFRSFFSGSPVKRIKWHRWVRNALICAGNADAETWEKVRGQVQKFIANADPVLNEAATWALDQQAAK